MPLGHLGGAHIFRGEFPRFSRDEKTRNPTTKAFGGHFLWHPLAPPLHPPGPRTHCRQIPRDPQGGSRQRFRPAPLAPTCTPLPPLAPPGPPWPPLAPPGPWPPPAFPGPPGCLLGPRWPPPFLAPLGPLPSLPFCRRDKCLPVLAAKAEVGIEGASPKP